MGQLTNDMARLRGEIDNLHDMRNAFVSNLQHDVFEMKADFRGAHAEMTKELRDDLMTFVTDLENSVGDMMDGIRDAHAEMASTLRETLDANEDTRMQEAQASRTERMAQITERVRHIGEKLADFRSAHTEMARRGKAERRTFVAGLKETVAGLRHEFSDDLAGARESWLGLSPIKAKSWIKTGPSPIKPKIRKKAEPKQTERLFPDDLTRIPGIGDGRQQVLNEAGIYTFTQLSTRTPDELEALLGKSGRNADVEEWINHAREL